MMLIYLCEFLRLILVFLVLFMALAVSARIIALVVVG